MNGLDGVTEPEPAFGVLFPEGLGDGLGGKAKLKGPVKTDCSPPGEEVLQALAVEASGG